MLQVYLVRHGETQWNAERRIQGQSDSPLTAKGEQQAMQVGERARSFGITHVISSDLGRTRRTAEIIAQACGCDITYDSRLRELNMGCWKTSHRYADARGRGLASPVGERHGGWSYSGRGIDAGAERSRQCGAGILSGAAAGKSSTAGQPRYRAGLLVSTILGLPAWAERRLRLRNCSISRVDYQESLWLAPGWVVETAGDISHLDAPALDELQR